ncbi:hypothetical protein N9D63_07620 [Opitutales bacterium]|jgi:hypothetical protein|nr:hypothetical protein [Opitutales bacterium]
MNTPIAFIVYKRPDTTRRVFETIRQARPPRLYLIADGPKSPDLKSKCREVRQIVESGIDWNCELNRIYSDKNLGCARRVQTGLDLVFEQEDQAIILEDDTLPDPSFFTFCEELLFRYKYTESVFHIAGMNMFPQLFTGENSYCFTSIANMWGWATWSRAWKHYDLQMPDWNNENKKQFLSKWCLTRSLQKDMGSMFDLHCDNDDPWTWDYQWFYACWRNNGLAVISSRNIVSNIGIGPDATHTVTDSPVDLYPDKLQSQSFPLIHPNTIQRDFSFEKNYRKLDQTPKSRVLKNYLKKKFPFFDKLKR